MKVNLRKLIMAELIAHRFAASYAAKENKGKIDVSVAQASEVIADFLEYLLDKHKCSEIIAKLEERK